MSLLDAFALLPAQLRAILDLDAAAMRMAIRKLHRDVEAALDAAADKCNESAPGETYEALLLERNTLRTTLANATSALESLRAEYAECLKELFATRKDRDEARDNNDKLSAELAKATFECSLAQTDARVMAGHMDRAVRGKNASPPPVADVGLAMRVLHAAPGKLCRPDCKAELDGVIDWLRSFSPSAGATDLRWQHVAVTREPSGREVKVVRGDGTESRDLSAELPASLGGPLWPAATPMAEPAPLTPTGELEAQVARLESRLECIVRHDDQRIATLTHRVDSLESCQARDPGRLSLSIFQLEQRLDKALLKLTERFEVTLRQVDGGEVRAARAHERVCERLTKLESVSHAHASPGEGALPASYLAMHPSQSDKLWTALTELGDRLNKIESMAHAPQPVASPDDVARLNLRITNLENRMDRALHTASERISRLEPGT
jgi:hypothetical protein